jgi:hypothetical protein
MGEGWMMKEGWTMEEGQVEGQQVRKEGSVVSWRKGEWEGWVTSTWEEPMAGTVHQEAVQEVDLVRWEAQGVGVVQMEEVDPLEETLQTL